MAQQKHNQVVDFSNPNADKIKSASTVKPIQNKQTSVMEEQINIELDEYSYDCSDGCCHHYGVITTLNGEELPIHNSDTETILKQVLEHLGYKVNIINKFHGEEI